MIGFQVTKNTSLTIKSGTGLFSYVVFADVANDDEEAGGVEGVFRLIGLGEKTRWKVADDSQQRLSLTSL